MADDVILNPGSGGDTIAADDVGGKKWQRIKVTLGADGANDGDVSSGNPMPVSTGLTQPLTDAELRAVAVPVSAATLPLPSGAATEATLDAVKTAVETIDNAIAGSEMQVDVVTLPSIPAGTNNIGDVDVLTLPSIPAGTNNIGDVDIASVPKSGTATLSNVNDSNSNQTLLASNANRIGVMVFNDSTVALYLKYGTTATSTSFTVKIDAGGYWEMPQPIYTGQLDGIWTSDASGAARITELT